MKNALNTSEKYKIRQLRKNVLHWAQKNQSSFAWRNNPTTYSILIAEFLLQRTRVIQAEKQFKIFLKQFPTFRKLQQAKPKDLRKLLAPLGLRKRILLLQRLIVMISKKYKGTIPIDYDELRKLPGVGDYTANAILIFALNKQGGIVDANVIRLFSELFNLKITREEGKKSKFIKLCAEYYSSLGSPRESNWYLLDYAIFIHKNKSSEKSDK